MINLLSIILSIVCISSNNNKDYGGNTALHYSCKGLSVECTRILLEPSPSTSTSTSSNKIKRANPNRVNKKHQLPIHLASMCEDPTRFQDSVEIVKLLLKHGSQINAQDIKVKRKMDDNGFSDAKRVRKIYIEKIYYPFHRLLDHKIFDTVSLGS